MVTLPTVPMFLWVIKMLKTWTKYYFFKNMFKTTFWICFNILMLLTRMIMGFYFFNFVIPCLDLEKKSGGGVWEPGSGWGYQRFLKGLGSGTFFWLLFNVSLRNLYSSHPLQICARIQLAYLVSISIYNCLKDYI